MANTKINVLVLGGSGMLGSMVVSYLSTRPEFNISTTVRSSNLAAIGEQQLPSVEWHKAVLGTDNDVASLTELGQFDWVINCTGATNRAIDESSPESIRNAVDINVGIPVVLTEFAEHNDTHVLQIATDCVYSGNTGAYVENAPHDALDVYGKSKSLGEVPHGKMHYLRCSIIGPEPKERKFLLEWVLAQPKNATLTGYSDHVWNGVTTLQFARIAGGIMSSKQTVPNMHHVIPADVVTKAELLAIIAEQYDRGDLDIQEQPTGTRVDRSLASNDVEENERIWISAGYSRPPTISEMIHELSDFDLPLNFDN
jgi:dTDP-4-dehydrorhamnose reductase